MGASCTQGAFTPGSTGDSALKVRFPFGSVHLDICEHNSRTQLWCVKQHPQSRRGGFSLIPFEPWSSFAMKTLVIQHLEQIVSIGVACKGSHMIAHKNGKYGLLSLCFAVWSVHRRCLSFVHPQFCKLYCLCLWGPTSGKCVLPPECRLILLLFIMCHSVGVRQWAKGVRKALQRCVLWPLSHNALWTQEESREICKFIQNKSSVLEQSQGVKAPSEYEIELSINLFSKVIWRKVEIYTS